MKSITIALLITSCFLINAQGQSDHESSPGAEIVKSSWQSRWDIHNTEKVPFSVDVKNTGTKTMVGITWQYIILDKYRQNGVIDTLTFESKKDIKPGETKHLSKSIDYSHALDNYTARTRLIRIKFADGTQWERKDRQ